MSFRTMLDEITLESLTEEQFKCFIEYYRKNYPEDYKSDLENLKEIYKMMNGSTFVGETLWKNDQLHQTFEKSSIAMTHKLDDMIEFPKLQPKRTYNEDLKCEIVMVKMPKCMAWLDDEPIEVVDKTIDIPMEVEPLDHTKLEDLGLNTCNRDIPLSSREIISVDESVPQPLPNSSPLNVIFDEKKLGSS
ncbi:hypothetical protein Tco_0287187 [Tanacetum coccineum]